MRISNKKALATAITMSLVLGVYGTAMATVYNDGGFVGTDAGYSNAKVTEENYITTLWTLPNPKVTNVSASNTIKAVGANYTFNESKDIDAQKLYFVLGGYSNSVNYTASSNKLTIGSEAEITNNGTNKSNVYAYGGYAYSDSNQATASDNNLTTLGTLSKYSGTSSDAETYAYVSGGYVYSFSGVANVTKNIVSIQAGTLAMATNGNVFAHVYGGYGYSKHNTATVTGNELTINGDALALSTNGNAYAYVYGGMASGTTATAASNKVTISGGTVVTVYGGYSECLYGNKTATAGGDSEDAGNEVHLTGVTVKTKIYGGYAYGSDLSTAKANYNKLIIDAGTISTSDITGGFAYGYDPDNVYASYNTLTINGGTFSNQYIYINIYGGYAEKSPASDGEGKSNLLEASDNTLTITGGIFGNANKAVNIYGGYVKNGKTNIAKDNKINISGTADLTYVNLYGYNDGATTHSGNALNIATDWSGSVKSIHNFDTVENSGNLIMAEKSTNIGELKSTSTLGFKAVGNAAKSANISGNLNFYIPDTALDNDIMLAIADRANVSGATINTDMTTYLGKKITLLSATNGIITDDNTKYTIGGEEVEYKEVVMSVTNMTSVNAKVGYDKSDNTKLIFGTVGYKLIGTSNITGAATLDATLDANKQTLNFYIPASAVNGDTMLTVDGIADLTGVTYIGYGVQKGSALKVNDSINLIKANSIAGYGSDVTVAKVAASDYQDYDMAVVLASDDAAGTKNLLKATVTKIANNENAKSPVETQAAGMAMLGMGGDVLAGAGMESAGAAAKAEKADNLGAANVMAPFAVIGGNNTRVNSGSHVDLKSWNLNVGFSKEVKNASGKLLFGPLVEYGNGSYDSYLDNGYHGDGRTNFVGVGFIAKQTNNDNTYYEGSLRAGRLANEYKSNGGNYDESTMYYGLHAGLGKVYQLNANNNIDLFLKAFWVHQNSMDTTLASKDLDMDAVDSFRSKLGFRYNHSFNAKNAMYAGLAWQYEFCGEAEATYDHMAVVENPSLKGHTGIMELGWKNNAAKNLELDLGINAYTGVQRGAGANIKLNWKF